jgi:hypothetical protein
VLSTNQKGAIAEASIAREAIMLGIGVFKPLTDLRTDYIFEVGTKLLRVQCKWAVRKGDALSVYCYSSRRARTGLVRRVYTAAEIDAFAAYCGDLDKCYFLPLDVFGERTTIQLRVGPARNNQQVGVHWAREYEFASVFAAIAA